MTPGTQDTTTNDPPSGSAPSRAETARNRRRRAPETARLYQTDWSAFAAWCDGERLAALPAEAATVASFLAAAAAKLSAGALGRRVAAIGERHRQV